MLRTALLLAGLAAVASAATTQKAPKRKTYKVTAPSKKALKTKALKSKGLKTKSPKYKPLKSRRSYQQAPTPDRYKEIQQALVDKGYLHGEPNGEWGADSVDALKRFQTEQNLTPDGKINSLSLIAMGLGPKRLTAQSRPQPPPEAPKTDLPR
jgi:murein L,D-transpeptidase YcbB/YkuD